MFPVIVTYGAQLKDAGQPTDGKGQDFVHTQNIFEVIGGTLMNITADNERAVFELLYKYWVDQESYENLKQEISFIDPQHLGFHENNIESIDIARQVADTDPVLFQNDLAKDWQKFVADRLSGVES